MKIGRRIRGPAFLLAGGLAAVVLLHPRSTFDPQISLTVHRYCLTNRIIYLQFEGADDVRTLGLPSLHLTTLPPEAGSLMQTSQTALLAHASLINSGVQPIGYSSQSPVPEYSCQARVGGHWVDCLYYHLTGGPWVLAPGETVDLVVWLPPDTSEWRLDFLGQQPSPRQRVADWLITRRLYNLFSEPALFLFPNKPGRFAELSSEIQKVPPLQQPGALIAPQVNQ